MSDYIRREDAVLAIAACLRFTQPMATRILESVKSADVVEQKHGQWILTDYEDEQTYKCSECGELWTFIIGTPKDNGANYCPNCGARMDGDS